MFVYLLHIASNVLVFVRKLLPSTFIDMKIKQVLPKIHILENYVMCA
jgi:hypothetical protein